MNTSGKIYGFVRLSNCYHSSPDCPVVKRMSNSEKIEMREYTEESRAVAAGHLRRCRLCLGDNVFQVEDRSKPVRMSNEQYAVLRCVTRIFKKNGSMTLREISEKRKRSVVSTYLIIKRLRQDGLIEHKVKMGGLRASGGSIIPSKLGIEIAESEPLTDDETP